MLKELAVIFMLSIFILTASNGPIAVADPLEGAVDGAIIGGVIGGVAGGGKGAGSGAAAGAAIGLIGGAIDEADTEDAIMEMDDFDDDF